MGGGEGFRRFQLLKTEYAPTKVHDLSNLSVFEDAVNRAAVAVFRRDLKARYPIPYVTWSPREAKSGGTIPSELTLEEVRARCREVGQVAAPSIKSNPLSPWLTGSKEMVKAISKVFGTNGYRAREGVNWGGALGVYQLEEVESMGRGLCLITNDSSAGRTEVIQQTAVIEDDLVFSLVKGRDVKRWLSQPKLHVLMTHTQDDPKKSIPEGVMKRSFPKTFSYLYQYRGLLLSRKEYKRWGGVGPFYELYRVGPYTFASYKVVFKDLTEFFQCAVTGPGENGRVVIPDYTLRMLAFEDGDEAFFVAGLLNSSPCVLALHATSVGVQTQRYHASDLEKLDIPPYRSTNRLHQKLVSASRECHKAAETGAQRDLERLEEKINTLAAELWKISGFELREIVSELRERGNKTSEPT